MFKKQKLQVQGGLVGKLKIYSDSSLIKQGQSHVTMLHPFWGTNEENPKNIKTGRFNNYMEVGQSFFELTSLEQADIAVFPIPWQEVVKSSQQIQLAKDFTAKAKQLGKKVIIFFLSDSVKPIALDNTIVFRTSLIASKRKNSEFAMPAWSEDFIERYYQGKLPIRVKSEKPVVGFCGQSKPLVPSINENFKGLLAFTEKFFNLQIGNYGSLLRAKGLRLLSESPLIETNFILRSGFFGGSQKKDGSVDLDLMEIVRKEYVQNMIESDYIFCCRGLGNYSYRLYETFSCGRIPVFVNTDCVLPYDFLIDYKKYCVWIEEKDLPHIAEKVAEFHSRISPEEFINLQHQCRMISEKYLSPTGFFANLHHHLN